MKYISIIFLFLCFSCSPNIVKKQNRLKRKYEINKLPKDRREDKAAIAIMLIFSYFILMEIEHSNK